MNINNQKFLTDRDKAFIEGYDYAVQQVLLLFQGNLDVFPDFSELLDDKKAIIKDNKVDIAITSIEDWAEMQRDELITGILDGYGEDKYNKIRESVLNEESKRCRETEN